MTGDLQLNSNAQGQGILLVDGDLHLGGGYEFFGIVIVQGALRGGNGGSKIWGTTYVKGDAEIGSELIGTPIVTLSSCAIEQAIKAILHFRMRCRFRAGAGSISPPSAWRTERNS